MATITDSLSSHLEQVSPRVAEYWNYDTELASKIKPSKVASATRYLYRIVVQQWPGGTRRKYIADRGDMGSGSGMKVTHLTAGFFDSTLTFEITKEQIDLSESSEQARINVMSKTIADAMTVLQAWDNIDLHTDGTGKLTNAASSSPGSTQLVFAASTDNLGVNRLFDGAYVDVWDATGATKRANGPYQITAIDENTKTVTFGAAPTAMASTDLLAVVGADSYGPSALTSFSSTWPGEALTSAPGLTGDSWRHGLGYVNDNTGANYYLGRLKSSFPQLQAKMVNADGDPLTFAHGELLKNLIIQKRGPRVLDGLMGVMHMAQAHRIKESGMAITRILQNPGQQVKVTDLQHQSAYGETFPFADIPCCQSRIQDKARVDFFNPKNWGRVEGHPTKYHKWPGGSYIFPRISPSTANQLAACEFHIVQKMDFVNDDPGIGGAIIGAQVMAGY